MRLQVKGKNVEVSDSIRRYAEDKLSKLDRQLHALTQVELELCVERNPSIAANQIAEATVWTKGPTLRAREASTDMKSSIDQLTDKLLRQVEHYRAKRSRRQVRGNDVPQGGSMSIPDDETGPKIVKTKQFAVKPMSAEEAALQLELVGHDFFVFRSDESNDVNVIYRRRDGGYGLIEPQG
jgi:putative sigma-54 modulation protein